LVYACIERSRGYILVRSTQQIFRKSGITIANFRLPSKADMQYNKTIAWTNKNLNKAEHGN
jgi:hypothetical protein